MLFRGLLVGAASGKMGALVASHNKGGQYMRARVTPSGAVATPAQGVVRNAMSSLATAWSQDLTADQRLAWADYALNVPGTNRIGDPIQLSGQNWYIACNVPRLQAGLPRVDDAPTIFDRGTPLFPSLGVVQNDTAGTITFGGTITAAASILVYQGHPFNIGRSKYYGSFQLVAQGDLSAGESRQTFTSAFPIDSSVSQQKYQIVVTQDDGRLSTPLGVTFQP